MSNATTILPPPKRSLNESVRKKENERIKLENRVGSLLLLGFLKTPSGSHFYLQCDEVGRGVEGKRTSAA